MIKATINLNNIKTNALEIKRLTDNKSLCAVVKSNAYGHGKEKVAEALSGIADYFAVATVKEGVELRLSGIVKPVLVLMPDKDVQRGIFYGLTLAVCSFRQFIAIRECAKKIGKTAYIHVKYDTGMNRFGVKDLRELQAILLNASTCGKVEVTGVFTHLFNPKSVECSKKQLMKFVMPCKMTKMVFPRAIRHVSASGGILIGRIFHLDMVRPGLMIYGYTPFETEKANLKRCMKISCSVLDVKDLKKGQPFLYGDYLTDFCGKASVIYGGYADGINYKVKNVINRPCMNVFSVRGEKEYVYEILNEERNAEVIAKENGTIPYEVLCSVTRNAVYEYIE